MDPGSSFGVCEPGSVVGTQDAIGTAVSFLSGSKNGEAVSFLLTKQSVSHHSSLSPCREVGQWKDVLSAFSISHAAFSPLVVEEPAGNVESLHASDLTGLTPPAGCFCTVVRKPA